ncbi:MAG: DNA polymerase IV [Mycoplasmataceae bacterium]|nr:DNA polymerase IV [Mycoplasmataceae bacterium]
MRYILHVDMNSYFASVEEAEFPQYRNKPIIVSGKTKRSVVASANYLARSFGIKAAMPIYMAKRLCPRVIIAIPHFNLYQTYADRFLQTIAEKFTNNIEIASIDECYVDITSLTKNNLMAVKIAEQIQTAIKKETGLKCSIGVANNKFLAKMGSDYKKPLGITTMWLSEIKEKLWPQPVENMLWVGKNSAVLLEEHGIRTIGDVAKDTNKALLEKLLDKNWIVHYYHANGHGEDQLDYSHNQPKSIGASETFLNDTSSYEEIKDKLLELTHEVVRRLQRHKLNCKTISVSIKTPDMKLHNKSFSLNETTKDFDKIFMNVINLYQASFFDKSVRLVGVSLSNLTDKEELVSGELFDDAKPNIVVPANNDLETIISKVNGKLSKDIINIAKDKLK